MYYRTTLNYQIIDGFLLSNTDLWIAERSHIRTYEYKEYLSLSPTPDNKSQGGENYNGRFF